jgi:predicted NBD/HSP70 family sugar kinase
MVTLRDALAELAAHPRAVPWRLRLHRGWSGAAPSREYILLAPALQRSARPVLARVHNAMLLGNPAAAELAAPLAVADLEPHLSAVRSAHRIGLHLAGEPVVPPRQDFDLPSVEEARVEPPGPGLAAGLDIGGTGTKACVLRDGELVRVSSAPTWPGDDRGVDGLVERTRRLLVEVAGGEPVGSLGIGLAAPMGVRGQVRELSTVLREQVGDAAAFHEFADRVAAGLVHGPTAIFNDLVNLGRYISAQGKRRLVRLQLGTSFGGCWIDTGGQVYATEMGRLVVDAGDDALPHPYLRLRGAMRAYLSNAGLAAMIAAQGEPVAEGRSGHRLREWLDAGDPRAEVVLDRLGDLLVGVVHELGAVLSGLAAVECGGSMLQGPAGRRLVARVAPRVPVPFTVAARPGQDGAIAAALAPRVGVPLHALRRVGEP